MVNLREKIQNNKVLLSNIGSLSVVQFINYLIPLITLPYVVRVLGPANYGIISFALAIINYFIIITDYGFNLTAVREVSVNRNNTAFLSKTFFSVLYSKLILLLLSGIFFLTIILFISSLKNYLTLIIILYLFVLGNIFYVQWFYQGLEKTKLLALINLVPKSIGVVLIFVFVKCSSDLILYALIISFVQLLVGMLSFYYGFKLAKISITTVNLSDIFNQLKVGWKLFLSTLSINFYTTTNIIILGALTNETLVGIYSAADKIRYAIQGLLNPISQSVFPRMNYLYNHSSESFLIFKKKLIKFQIIPMFSISLFAFIFAKEIVMIILGEQYVETVLILKILSWLPFIISVSNIYGIQFLLTMKEDNKFLFVVVTSAFLSLIVVYTLTSLFKEIGTAVGTLSIEMYVSFLMYIFYKKSFKKNEV